MTPALAPEAIAQAATRPRLTVAWTMASAAIGAVGVAFLVGMFVAFAAGARSLGMALGLINDGLVLASYALIVPAIVLLRGRFRPLAPRAMDIASVIGLLAVGWIIVLQGLLILGVLTFEEQIGWVSIAFIAFDAWLLVVGWLGGRSGTLPGGIRMGLIGATYVGYPVWALWAARRLDGGSIIRPTGPVAR